MSRSQEGVSGAWLVAGPLAGLLAVSFDLIWLRGLSGPWSRILLTGLGWGLAAGLVVGAGAEAFVVWGSGRDFTIRDPAPGDALLWWQILSIPWLPPAWLLAEGSLSGHRVRQVMDPSWSVPLAAILAAWAMGAALLTGGWLFRRSRARRMAPLWRWLGLAALCGLSLSLSGLDARLYVRLYPEIHAAMTLVSFLALFLAMAVAFSTWTARRRHAVWLVAATFMAGLLLGRPAVGPLRRSQRVRRALFSMPFTGMVLGLVARRPSGQAWKTGGPLQTGGSGTAGFGAGPIDLRGASVLLVTVDALRADRVGCYGLRSGPSLTPNLDDLCAQAVRFQRAYCHAPHSSYSLSSVQTGMPMRSLTALGEPLPRTLADILSSHGYRTEAFCTNGIFFTEGEKLRAYQRRGFGFHHLDPNGYDGKVLTDKALKVLDELASDTRPFYLWVHYFDVHEPYRFRKGITKGHSAVDRYDGEVRYVDPLVAKLIRRARGLGRPVVVVLTADHGEEFGEHGGSYHGSSLYEEQTRVPLLWWIPGQAPRKVDTPVSLVDLAPTILDVLRIPYQGAIEGHSLAGLAAGAARERGPVFAEVATKKMVVDGSFKLIYDTWRSLLELYDLSSDPRERRNLADSRPQVVARLRGLLASHAAHLSSRLAGLPRALALARLGDAGAKDALCRLVLDTKALLEHRIEAARRLAKMPGGCSEEALCSALLLPGRKLRREAAVALGELESACGRAELLMLLSEAVPARLRHRAAVAAGRLGLPEAQPYLVEALGDPDPVIRYRAGHYLGRIGDRRAVRALMAATRDRPAAHLVAFALGRIGARSGGQVSVQVGRFLKNWLPHAHSLLVKRYILKAMGLLHRSELAASVLPFLGRKTVREAEETLVRCQGISRLAYGVDFSPTLGASRIVAGQRIGGLDNSGSVPFANGLTRCRARDPLDFKYLHATTCRARGAVELGFEAPAQMSGSWTASLRVRVVGQHRGPARVRLTMNGHDLGVRTLAPGWQDLTWRFEGSSLGKSGLGPSGGSMDPRKDAPSQEAGGRIVHAGIRVAPSALELELDHLLLFPENRNDRQVQ